MRLYSISPGFLQHRFAAGFGLTALMFLVFLTGSSFKKHSDPVLRSKQVNLIIRQIGHKLLLQAGDSTSRVLPVIQKEGTFLLKFEKEFVFSHDSLMLLANNLLLKTQFPSGYTVTVHDCNEAEIVYGFQLNNTTPDILACNGRTQPKGCYTIEFAFADFYGEPENKKSATGQLTKSINHSEELAAKPEFPAKTSDNSTDQLNEIAVVESGKTNTRSSEIIAEKSGFPIRNLVYSSIAVLLCAALLIVRFGKRVKPEAAQNQNQATVDGAVANFPALGRFLVDAKGQRLLLGSEVISLTEKEYKVLELLNKNFGELIPRETLMQEVWINEGVITGRSLDMFISKLRKKLSADPVLRITNIHGKGYRLESVHDFIA